MFLAHVLLSTVLADLTPDQIDGYNRFIGEGGDAVSLAIDIGALNTAFLQKLYTEGILTNGDQIVPYAFQYAEATGNVPVTVEGGINAAITTGVLGPLGTAISGAGSVATGIITSGVPTAVASAAVTTYHSHEPTSEGVSLRTLMSLGWTIASFVFFAML